MRSLGHSIRILVASPQLASRIISIADLSGQPTLATTDEMGDVT
jgi:hypothetical protein